MPKDKKKKKKHIVLKIILWTMLVGILILVGLGAGFISSIMNGAGALSKADFEINKFTTYIYDKDGNEYTTINSGENRTYASLSECSPYLPKAFISIEDERFETHCGIDIKRTLGATVKYVLSKLKIGKASYGGSTITQQVIKKVTGEEDRDAKRKIREIVRAFKRPNHRIVYEPYLFGRGLLWR